MVIKVRWRSAVDVRIAVWRGEMEGAMWIMCAMCWRRRNIDALKAQPNKTLTPLKGFEPLTTELKAQRSTTEL